MVTQEQYWKKPDESIPEYNARISSARKLDATSGGESASSLLGKGNINSTASGGTPYSKFGMALMQMLKKYQGLGTGKFVDAELKGREEKAGRIMKTAEPGMPPNLQSQVRNADAGAMDPTIRGAGEMKQTFAEQIQGLGNVLEQSQAIGQWMETSSRQKKQDALNLIFAIPETMKKMDDDVKKKLEKDAGLSPGTIDLLEGTGEEKWSDPYDMGGNTVQKNEKTGEVKILVKAPTGAGEDSDVSGYQLSKSTDTIRQITELIDRVSGDVVGWKSLLSFLPESEQKNFDADVESLKAKISFGELTAMRAASKTGGALGQVSNMENRLLQSVLGSLDTKQSPEQFKKNLNDIKASITRWLNAQGIEVAPDGSLIKISD